MTMGSTWKTETRKEESVRHMWELNSRPNSGDSKAEHMNEEGKERRKDWEWGVTWGLQMRQINVMGSGECPG
jgi:hypothetical protein